MPGSQPAGPLRAWFAASGVAPVAGQTCAIFDDLTILIRRSIGYKRREEPGVQSPAETLRFGNGSCRDMAVLIIEVSRALGYDLGGRTPVPGIYNAPESLAIGLAGFLTRRRRVGFPF